LFSLLLFSGRFPRRAFSFPDAGWFRLLGISNVFWRHALIEEETPLRTLLDLSLPMTSAPVRLVASLVPHLPSLPDLYQARQ